MNSFKINKNLDLDYHKGVGEKKTESNRRKHNPFNYIKFDIGIYLLIPLLIGVFIGYNLDLRLKTKPLFTIIFLSLGTVSSFYNLWKLTKK